MMNPGTLTVVGLLWLIPLVWLSLRPTPQPARQDLLAGALLYLFTAGFFWRVYFGGMAQPADGGDLVSFLYPTYRFAASQLSQGSLPLWNPTLYGGAPFIADIQAGFLYPPNLLLFLLAPRFDYTTLQALVHAHLFWAGLGTYLLVRSLPWGGSRLSRPAALLAALAFQFSDPLLIHLGNLNLIAVLSWLPWVLAAFTQGLERRSPRWAALTALLFGVANSAGHAQSSLYIGLALLLYTLFWGALRLTHHRSHRARLAAALYPAALLLLVGLLTALLSAPLLLPAAQLTPHTARSSFTYQESVHYSLAPTQAIGLVTPGFFGRGPALHWSLWDRVETPYAGAVTLALALAALVLVRDRATRRRLWPWLGMALVSFAVALGIYALPHGWLTQLLPGFGQFRAPARILALWTLAAAVLAAAGLDALTAQRPAHAGESAPASEPAMAPVDALFRAGTLLLGGIFTPLLFTALLLTQDNPTAFVRASVAALAVSLAAGFWALTWVTVRAGRSGWLSAPACATALVGLLYLELGATGAYTDISPDRPDRGFHHPEIVAYLQSDPEPFRIDSRTDIQDLWQPNTAALHGLQDVGGIANPLTLRHWQSYLETAGGRDSPLYAALNVKYLVARDETPLPAQFRPVLDAPGPLSLFVNEKALPRAWLVHAYTIEPAARAFATLPADPSATVQLVETEPGVPPPPATAPASGVETVTITHYGSSELRLAVRATAPGLLVLSEVWYPGWSATVDGRPAPVWRANGALRAVPVPAGETTVHLRFAPAGWQTGLLASLLGLLLVSWLGLRRNPLSLPNLGRGKDGGQPPTAAPPAARNVSV